MLNKVGCFLKEMCNVCVCVIHVLARSRMMPQAVRYSSGGYYNSSAMTDTD